MFIYFGNILHPFGEDTLRPNRLRHPRAGRQYGIRGRHVAHYSPLMAKLDPPKTPRIGNARPHSTTRAAILL